MKVSIIIPACNEENVLGEVLDSVENLITREHYEAEVIVIDDGSRDRTADVAESKGVHVLRHEKNQGYGRTLKTGIQASKHQTILIIDGDGSYPVDEIPALLTDIDQYQMVVGARIKKNVKMPFLRRMAKWILTKLAECLVMETIPDINSGLRVFKKSMYERYARLLPDGFSFTLTITLASFSNHEKIKFVPISYCKRKGRSKIRPIHDTSNFFLLIIRTILYFNPIRVLLPLAGIFLLAAIILAVYSIFIVGRFMDVSVTVLSVFAVQLALLGLVADLLNRRVQ